MKHELNGYQTDVLHVYQSIHVVLNQVHVVWCGIHSAAAMYLYAVPYFAEPRLLFGTVRAGIGRLLKLFATSTHPAAIALLSEYLSISQIATKRKANIQQFMDEPKHEPSRNRCNSSPFRKIQDHIRGYVKYVITACPRSR